MSYFSRRLKLLRINYNFTQPDMAELLNIKTRSYQKYEEEGENGREPKLETICFISRYFCVSTDWLLGIDDNPRQEYYYHRALNEFKINPATEKPDIAMLLNDQEIHKDNIPALVICLRAVEEMRDIRKIDLSHRTPIFDISKPLE